MGSGQMPNIYRLKVDLKLKQTGIVPTFVQYDSARLEFQIFDGGQLFDLTGYTSVEFAHKKPDGSVLVGNGVIETDAKGNKIVAYDYQGSEMNAAGVVETSFSLIGVDNKKISIQTFRVSIVKDLRDDVLSPTNPEYSKLQEYSVQMETIIADADSATTNAREMKLAGAYNSTVAYKKNNTVTFNGESYMAKKAVTGVAPTGQASDPNWSILARKGADGTGTVIRHREEFIATAGQTVFNLQNSYDQYQNRIDVSVGNVPQFSPDNFQETTATRITLTEGASAGDKVIVTYFSQAQPIASDLNTKVEGHNTQISNNNILLADHTNKINDVTEKLADIENQLIVSDTPPLTPVLNQVWLDTDFYKPAVSPTDNESVEASSDILVTFNKWLDDTIPADAVQLYPTLADRDAGTNPISGTSVKTGNKTIEFDATNALAPQASYYGKVLGGVTFFDGTGLGSDFLWTFKAVGLFNSLFSEWNTVTVSPSYWTKLIEGSSPASVVEQTTEADAEGGKTLHVKANSPSTWNAVSISQNLPKAYIEHATNLNWRMKPQTLTAGANRIGLKVNAYNSANAVVCRFEYVLEGAIPTEGPTAKYVDLTAETTLGAYSIHQRDFKQDLINKGFDWNTVDRLDFILFHNAAVNGGTAEAYWDYLKVGKVV